MKKQTIEFVFVIIIVILGYLVVLTDISFKWKVLCLSFYGVIILITIFSLMLEYRSAQNTLLWIYILLFLPVIGYLFYWYSGQLLLKGTLFKRKRANDREVLETISKRVRKTDFSKLNNHQQCFARYLNKVSVTHSDPHTKTTILKDGTETFQEIKRRLKEANEFIHMEYYTFRSDRLGKDIMEILIEKARERVEVRLIYDAVGSVSLSSSDINRMKDAGIHIHPFNPIRSGLFNQRFNFRNHRKIIVIDGKIGFVGGLNIGVEYLGEDEDIGFWRDTHVVLKGTAVQTLHSVFLLDWLDVTGEMLVKDERYRKVIPAEADGLVHVVATGPETEDMSDHYYTMISCATKSIWIASPYFVPNQAIRTALRIAAQKGIQVRIMVPERNDGFLTQYASQSYFPEALRNGIEVYLYQKGFLHEKIIIIDGDLATIGTANMDMRSFRLNLEVNLFLTGTESIQELTRHYEEDLQECCRLRPVEFYKRGMDERVKESFARLFSGVL
ncbi:cardiolipin synthase [Bacillus sp. UNC438CL73TsuS30]|uniref:cardiolipin synthase n=1 Tax=Bacillus sp. UNC438CL73TsuS30 TaxID=1340434 RepID=UPI00047B7D30|nr:cardiolipin synthase [Bacillus sp. UNC438CL73TsuS30]